MPRLTPPERERAIGMLQSGTSSREIARRLHCSHTTILRLNTRFTQTGSTRDRPRPGQRRVTTARQDRQIVRDHLRDRTRPATTTAAQVQGRRGYIHPNTVRNRLHATGLHARRPYVGPILTDRHRNARFDWANRHRNWRLQQWHGVVFSDESRFHLRNADGRLRVWRRPGERYNADCVVQTDRWGGGSVMVWGAIPQNTIRTLKLNEAAVHCVS